MLLLIVGLVASLATVKQQRAPVKQTAWSCSDRGHDLMTCGTRDACFLLLIDPDGRTKAVRPIHYSFCR